MNPNLEKKLQEAAAKAKTKASRRCKGPVSSIRSLCIVAGIAATIASFSQPAKPGLDSFETREERILTAKAGTSIKFRLVEKTGDSIVANRSSDGKRFVIPLDSLSEHDQKFLTSWNPGAPGKPLESINTPDKVFLALPFDKQTRGGICTAAALLNVIQYVDPSIKLSQDELFTLFSDRRTGANYPQIQAALRTLGYDAQEFKFGGKDDDLIRNSLRESLSARIPALSAKSGHMITAIGFDSTNPEKKTITIWDQRTSEESATDLESLGVVSIDEKEFSRRFGTLILIKPKQKMIMDDESLKICKRIAQKTKRDVTGCRFIAPTSEPLLEYTEHALNARISVELRKENRVFIKANDTVLYEIVKIPDPKNRDRMWQVIELYGSAPNSLSNMNISDYINTNNGVFYSALKQPEKPIVKADNKPVAE